MASHAGRAHCMAIVSEGAVHGQAEHGGGAQVAVPTSQRIVAAAPLRDQNRHLLQRKSRSLQPLTASRPSQNGAIALYIARDFVQVACHLVKYLVIYRCSMK